MVGRKAVVRVIEAVIAVMLIFGALLLISSQKEIVKSQDISEIIVPILNEMAQNKTLRSQIILYNLSEEYNSSQNGAILESIESYSKLKLNNPSLNLSARICAVNATCYLEPLPMINSDIYAVDRSISTDLKEKVFTPRRVKLFLWRN